MPTGAAAAASAPNEVIEFAAVRTIGKRTEIDLYDTQGKKNHWIALGATADGMTVMNYDSRRDQVVAKIGGVEKVLPLRKTRGAAQPLSIARQEEEARMLVSDLLEIGMAQRKAYEEKQKQAADPNAAPATPPPPAQPTPGGPPSGG